MEGIGAGGGSGVGDLSSDSGSAGSLSTSCHNTGAVR